MINDLYGRNPIEYLDKNKREEYNKGILESKKVKTDRVVNYLGSDGIKSTLNQGVKESNYDKITNFNKETLMRTLSSNDPKKFKTNAPHIFEGKHGYYR